MNGRPRATALVVLGGLLAAVLVAACGGSSSSGAEAPAANPKTDKLAQVLARGTLIVSSDPAYPPQSFAVEGAVRPEDTKCAPNQLTAAELDGYDVRTAIAVAEKLVVEPCFVTPLWTEVTAGNWGERWDISIGSMDITRPRMEVLYFTQPYYATPQYFFVREDSTVTSIAGLAGKRIGVCAGCVHEDYLLGTLDLPGQEVDVLVQKPKIVGYDTEPPGLVDLGDGKLDAFLCAEQVGLQAIKDGLPLKKVGAPVFYGYSAAAVDRSSGKSAAAFVERVSEIILELERDGTLAALALDYFGVDYAAQAAAFDLGSIGQQVT